MAQALQQQGLVRPNLDAQILALKTELAVADNRVFELQQRDDAHTAGFGPEIAANQRRAASAYAGLLALRVSLPPHWAFSKEGQELAHR